MLAPGGSGRAQKNRPLGGAGGVRLHFFRRGAEKEGFEPPVPVRVHLISSQAHSTTLALFRREFTGFRVPFEQMCAALSAVRWVNKRGRDELKPPGPGVRSGGMAYAWHPYARPELDGEGYVVSQLTTGLFYRVSGSIVELLSQMPFDDFAQAASEWRRRSGATEADLVSVEKTWSRLCHAGLVVASPEGVAHRSALPPLVLGRRIPSRLDRFVEMQDFIDADDEAGQNAAHDAFDPHDPYGI